MNLDLLTAARVSAGRVLIAAGRRLSRAGARLLRHPSARPPLRAVEPIATTSRVYDFRRDAL